MFKARDSCPKAETWIPLLDEEETTALTVEAIGAMTTPDELRVAWLKAQEMPLTAVERRALEAAIQERAGALNISSWDFQPYDNGVMAQAATAMQDALISGSAVVQILDDTKGKPLRVRFKASEANVVSLNDRVYLREVMEPAVGRAAARIRAGVATFGEDGHPPMDAADTQGRPRYRRTRSKAVLMPENVFMDGNVVYLDARILEDTEPGRRTAADVRAGTPVTISTRAYGGDLRVAALADGRQVKVPLVMELETWDRVEKPAFPDARPVSMLDSIQVQAILDSIQKPAAAGTATHTQPAKEEPALKWSLTMVKALSGTPEGRRELAAALTDSTLTDEIRVAMTDALAQPATVAPPAAAPSQEAIQAAVTDALTKAAEDARRKEQERADARAAAAAYVTEEIQKLRDGNKYPAPLLDSVTAELKDVSDKAMAEVLLRQQIRLADSLLASTHLAGMGYGGAAGVAALQHIQVREGTPWKPIVDNLIKAFDDWRVMSTGERPDPEIRKVNKPFVDKLMAKFEGIHARSLVDSARAWNQMTDAITAADLYTQPVIQRALLEQAFGDADMLQFLYADVFEGDAMRIPVEYFEAPTSVELDISGSDSIPEAKVKTTWLSFSPTPRRVRVEIENDVQLGMTSGPLRYNAAARALYHSAALIRRVMNQLAGNEMLRAADAYAAVQVTDEAVDANECTAVADAGNVAFRITLRRGGNTGALTATNTDRPIVRPRKYKSISDAGAVTEVTEHGITVTLDGSDLTQGYLYTDADGIKYVKDAKGDNLANAFAVDYENGYVYISDGSAMVLGATPVLPTIDYYYATNFDTFSLTVPDGTDAADHYNGLLRQGGMTAATMAKHPRYMAPNFALGSITAMEYIVQASLFYAQNSPKGTTLNPNTGNYIGSRNGVDYAKHNTQWQAGDNRILYGRVGATKYGVRDPLRQEGPFPSYDASRKVVAAKQWYAEEFSVMLTPEVKNQSGTTLNPYYRTIKLKS